MYLNFKILWFNPDKILLFEKFRHSLTLSIRKTSEEIEARQREKIKNYWKGGRINDI